MIEKIKSNTLEYVAIRVLGFKYFIWFEQKNVTLGSFGFSGKNGWGKSGGLTDLECRYCDIEAVITSDSAQYS